MSIFKLHEDNLSESLRRIAFGLTGLQKRVFSDSRNFFGGGIQVSSFRCASSNSGITVSGSGRPGANHLPQHHRRGDKQSNSRGKPEMHHPVLRQNYC